MPLDVTDFNGNCLQFESIDDIDNPENVEELYCSRNKLPSLKGIEKLSNS